MKTYSISKLARAFALSRSTLLYYDRIGLLPASGRTGSGYRTYTEKDRRQLDRICQFRQAGLPLGQIQRILKSPGTPFATILRRRLSEIGGQIIELKQQQQLLAAMLKQAGECQGTVNKALWVEMLKAAGMDETGMARWHSEFELRSPEGHHNFLASLGIEEKEIRSIRNWAAAFPKEG